MQNSTVPSKKRFFDTQINILILQVVTVFIVVVTALVIRFFGGRLYLDLSTAYHSRFDAKTDVKEVLETNATPQVEQNDFEEAEETDEFEKGAENTKLVGEYDFSLIKTNLSKSNNITNNFIWPVNSGRISSSFGYRTNPITKVYCLHGGTDIAVETGTPVMAALSGKVSVAAESATYGKYIIIEHSEELFTVYAHCSELLANKGDAVSRGEIVALSGNTGRSTGPHLHFEIRINGNKIDPEWLLEPMVEL